MRDIEQLIEETFKMVTSYISNLRSYEDACILYYAGVEINKKSYSKIISEEEYFLIKVFDKENKIGIYVNKDSLFKLYTEIVSGGLHSFYKIYHSRKGLKSNNDFIEEVIEEIALDFLNEVNYEIENKGDIKMLLLSFSSIDLEN